MRSFVKGAIAGGALTVLGAALSSAPMLATASCEGQECDPSWADYGCASADVDPENSCCMQGDMIDDDTWESTPQSADWLEWPGFRTWRLHIAGWTGNRVPVDEKIEAAFVPSDGTSNPFPADDPPDAPVSAATSASGNYGEVSYAAAGLVEVKNDTCAPYLVRVLVSFSPPPDGGLTPAMMGPCMKMKNGKGASPLDGG